MIGRLVSHRDTHNCEMILYCKYQLLKMNGTFSFLNDDSDFCYFEMLLEQLFQCYQTVAHRSVLRSQMSLFSNLWPQDRSHKTKMMSLYILFRFCKNSNQFSFNLDTFGSMNSQVYCRKFSFHSSFISFLILNLSLLTLLL